MVKTKKVAKQLCTHCGEPCTGQSVEGAIAFCCSGCETVYEILNTPNFQQYYCLNERPGITVKPIAKSKFAYLDEPDIAADTISFRDSIKTVATFYLPQIHCSSCLWLLEHLPRFGKAILGSQVNFITKKITITFLHQAISLRQVAELLASIGYTPQVNDASANSASTKKYQPVIKLGVAFFCFANIMLFSFPEYLGLDAGNDPKFLHFFRTASLVLSLPVLLYCAQDIFIGAWKGLQHKYINIDAPIALAILVCFGRSVVEILSNTGSGYLDSMSGIILLMLAGRFLQAKAFHSLQFERTNRSFFPIGVTVITDGKRSYRKAEDLVAGERIALQQEEIVPVSCTITAGNIKVDNSFITGEPLHISTSVGDTLFAGARVVEGTAVASVAKPFSQNNFLQLWEKTQTKETENGGGYLDKLSRYFSAAILLLAASGFAYWHFVDAAQSWKVVTAVLIIACPCTLLLASSFMHGYLLSRFGKKGLFLKNHGVMEKLCNTNKIVFDKTGTLTRPEDGTIRYIGEGLSVQEKNNFLSLMALSRHPLCRAVLAGESYLPVAIDSYKEHKGQGMEAWIAESHYKAGNSTFANGQPSAAEGTSIHLCIDGIPKGKFIIGNDLRPGIAKMIAALSSYSPALISGDNSYSKVTFEKIFPSDSGLHFQQQPEDKYNFIAQLQNEGKKVMMVGDGLNDAGALATAYVGVAIADHSYSFTPACDAILSASQVAELSSFLKASRQAKRWVVAMLTFSLLYNFIGLSFALSGQLQPLVAAILMPASSLSVIGLAWLGARYIAEKIPMRSHLKT